MDYLFYSIILMNLVFNYLCCCNKNVNQLKSLKEKLIQKDINTLESRNNSYYSIADRVSTRSHSDKETIDLGFEVNDVSKTIDPDSERLISYLKKNKIPDQCLLHCSDYIREEEKEIIKFTMRNTIEIYCKIINDPNLEMLYNKPNDPLLIKWNKSGWELNKEIFIAFHKYTMDISSFIGTNEITLDVVKNLIYNPEILICWDKNIKVSEVLSSECDLDKKSSSILFHRVFYSPIPFTSERDREDKQVVFTYENRCYAMTTSVEEGKYVKKPDEIERMKTYISLFNFYIEYSENSKPMKIIFFGVNQVDPKMKLPDFILNFTVPIQSKGWYNNLFKVLMNFSNGGYQSVLDMKK